MGLVELHTGELSCLSTLIRVNLFLGSSGNCDETELGVITG